MLGLRSAIGSLTVLSSRRWPGTLQERFINALPESSRCRLGKASRLAGMTFSTGNYAFAVAHARYYLVREKKPS